MPTRVPFRCSLCQPTPFMWRQWPSVLLAAAAGFVHHLALSAVSTGRTWRCSVPQQETHRLRKQHFLSKAKLLLPISGNFSSILALSHQQCVCPTPVCATTSLLTPGPFRWIQGENSRPTPYHDKVTLYTGMVAKSGTGDVWSINPLLTMAPASGAYNAQGIELDFNNLNAHRGDADAGAGLAPPVAFVPHLSHIPAQS